jgi:class 3 adenylate cyclase
MIDRDHPDDPSSMGRPTVTNDERLAPAELASETDTSLDHLAEIVEAGILRPDADGWFRSGDIQRVLVTDALVQAGLSVDLLRKGIEAGIVSFEDTDSIYPPPGRRGPSARDLATELGLAPETLLRIITAFGIARPDAATRLYEPDAAHLRAFVEAWRPLGDDDLLVRAARIYGDALRRAAEGWTGIFEAVVVGPLRDRALPWREMRQATMEPGLRMLAVGRSLLGWLLDQHLFGLLNQLNFDSIERQLAILGIAPTAPREPSAIVFADLTGYTRFTEEHGDEAAAALATRLAVVADEVGQDHRGRLVKLLGDGVMLHFAQSADALAAAVELRAAMAPAGLPATHIGIDAGTVIRREADVYGRTVNVAARLAAAAGPGQILVSDAALRAARSEDATLPEMSELPPLELKGMPEPIPVHLVED